MSFSHFWKGKTSFENWGCAKVAKTKFTRFEKIRNASIFHFFDEMFISSWLNYILYVSLSVSNLCFVKAWDTEIFGRIAVITIWKNRRKKSKYTKLHIQLKWRHFEIEISLNQCKFVLQPMRTLFFWRSQILLQ